MKIRDRVIKSTIRLAVDYAIRNPKKNLRHILSLVNRVAKGNLESQRALIGEILDNPKHPYHTYILHIVNDIDKEVIKAALVNFIVNADIIGWEKQQEYRRKYQCNVPWTILIDPTSACNLHCIGCWAADYGRQLNLSLDQIDAIITQGKELGVYFYIYTGGEPLTRKKDLITICEKHPDCEFLCFTNATLIDEAFAEEMLRVKNFIPAISIEGSEDATDLRRGKGVYQKAITAIKLLKGKRLAFGMSCCYTSENCESITSPDFYDEMIVLGALFVWYFHYMPVGNNASLQLLPTKEQRKLVIKRIRAYRSHKPLFAVDFQNDAEYVEGCIAGGRRYLHINSNGDIEPCVFIHYSDSNIRNKSLLEALQSPLFMAYHKGQPFNENMLQPCPMLENPEKLRQMVNATGARSTDLMSPETVEHLCGKCEAYASCWAKEAKCLWEGSENQARYLKRTKGLDK